MSSSVYEYVTRRCVSAEGSPPPQPSFLPSRMAPASAPGRPVPGGRKSADDREGLNWEASTAVASEAVGTWRRTEPKRTVDPAEEEAEEKELVM